MKSNSKNKQNLGRRDFLRLGGISAALGFTALASIPQKVVANTAEKEIQKRIIKEEDEFPIEVSESYQPPRAWDQVLAQAFYKIRF